MKKLLQIFFCYKNIEVTDADSGRKEVAHYRMILGYPIQITYKPIKDTKSSERLATEITGILSECLNNATPVLE